MQPELFKSSPQQTPSQIQNARPARTLENTSPDSSRLVCGMGDQVLAALGVRVGAGIGS